MKSTAVTCILLVTLLIICNIGETEARVCFYVRIRKCNGNFCYYVRVRKCYGRKKRDLEAITDKVRHFYYRVISVFY